MVWCEQADGKRVLARRGRIDPDDGLVWAFARTTTKGGVGVDSVITFNTTVPSALKSAYWHVDGHWFEPAYPEDRPALFATLGVQQEDVFPYSKTWHQRNTQISPQIFLARQRFALLDPS